jgi:multisubunit Na+/H+ antiporter MnhB subunit
MNDKNPASRLALKSFLTAYAASASLITSIIVGYSIFTHRTFTVYEWNPYVAFAEICAGVSAFVLLLFEAQNRAWLAFKTDRRLPLIVIVLGVSALVYIYLFALPDNGIQLALNHY